MNTKQFILGGNATFTVKNITTENRFTFKVRKKKDVDLYWVFVMTGSDNETSFSFLGSYAPSRGYKHSFKSYIGPAAVAAKVAEYYFKHLFADTLPTNIVTYHEGFCGRCGRKLTVPESIESGFGPECVKFIK